MDKKNVLPEKNKKLTIRDIAEACGVSTATVSYVLNNRLDQRISDKTRNRVLHYVHLMGYQSSAAARALATGDTHTIGLYCGGAAACPDAAIERSAFAEVLAAELEQRGYLLALLSDGCMRQSIRTVDAILAVDLPQADFTQLGENCFFPLVCVDGVVENQSLFYQLNYDYRRAAEQLKERSGCPHGALIAHAFANQALNERLCGCFDAVHFYTSEESAIRFLARLPADTAPAVLGGVLGLRLQPLCGRKLFTMSGTEADIPLPLKEKCAAATELLLALLRDEPPQQHDVLV